MPLDLDYELRLAVFDHIRRLADARSSYVTAEQLNAGLIFRGERVPVWNQQKGIFRPAVLRDFGAALTIHTSFNSPYDDHDHPDQDRLVYRYRGKNPSHSDNVALRRAMQLRRPLLYLISVQPGIYYPVFPCYVVADRPDDLAVELVADAIGSDIVQSGESDVLANPGLKAYATRTVKQRLHQGRFRYAVIRAYRRQCAMCRLRHTPLLDAAHILPDRDERSLPEIPNGLALCRIHHGAYDVGIIGVDPDYLIHVRPDVLAEHDGPMLRYGLQEMEGGRIQVPSRLDLKPNRDYLAERFGRFKAA